MNNQVLSLRLRLFLLILTPLLLVALFLGFWRYSVAQDTAEELFDRGLLSTALAISRDVAISEGDALSRTTRDLIEDATGGELFYHVTGPGGIYVTGYAYPPRLPGEKSPDAPIYALADYRGELVRAFRMTERTSIGNLSGDTTVTVWQRMGERENWAQQLALRAALLMAALLAALALVVWFGVQRGLRPLHDLHNAIALRSPEDLSRIKRPLPIEVTSIVATLNRLFEQLESNLQAHQVFISDAAHQLRNPAAAILSLAETLSDVDDDRERDKRINELVQAARTSARLADQLLSLERLRLGNRGLRKESLELNDVAREACLSMGSTVLERGVEFNFEPSSTALPIHADRVMLVEAIRNLIDNSLQHGGPELDMITVRTACAEADIAVTVVDNGKGLDPKHADVVLSRFGQLEPSSGSGLGLAIVLSIAEQHGGSLKIDSADQGACLSMCFPVSKS